VTQQEDRFSLAFLYDSLQGAARVLEVVSKVLDKHPPASGFPVATQVKCAYIEAQIIQACGYMIVAATVFPEPVHKQDTPVGVVQGPTALELIRGSFSGQRTGGDHWQSAYFSGTRTGKRGVLQAYSILFY